MQCNIHQLKITQSIVNMKIFTFISSIVIAATFTKASDEETINVVCNPSEDGWVVFVPHPYECKKYFMCQGMNGIAMHCPANLQFDTNLNVCNYAQIVNCVNTPYPTTSTTEITSTASKSQKVAYHIKEITGVQNQNA